MKVFLSHSTKDKEFVQTLAQQLQSVRIEPWLCEVDVLFGDDFVEKIERGLQEADVTLLVWFPEAGNSVLSQIFHRDEKVCLMARPTRRGHRTVRRKMACLLPMFASVLS